MKNTISILLVTLLMSATVLAQDWSKTRILVQPGQSAGAFKLGEPVPSNADDLYGKANFYTDPDPGVNGKDSGSVVYGRALGLQLRQGMLVKLNDGVNDRNVYSIYVRRVRAYTSQGAYFGMTLQKVAKLYPNATKGKDALTGSPTLTIPGLVFVFENQHLAEMVVVPK